MKFTILINASPYTHQAADSAYFFARAVAAAGHQIARVFFYHDGVGVAAPLQSPPDDDRHLLNRWRELARAHAWELVVCVAAAQRRGVLSADEAARCGLSGENLAEGFQLGGLGMLIEACIDADRVVTFGD